MFKAIFFDRDGTLTFNNPEKELWRKETMDFTPLGTHH